MNTRKDEKIQLYRKVERKIEGTTRKEAYRQFIYSQAKYLSGGLWANARDISAKEIVSMGMQQEVENVKFIVNRNSLIKEDLKVIYRGEVYDIKAPIDKFDGRVPEISFIAVKTVDTTSYQGDMFYE